jgi:hypothetical protein
MGGHTAALGGLALVTSRNVAPGTVECAPALQTTHAYVVPNALMACVLEHRLPGCEVRLWLEDTVCKLQGTTVCTYTIRTVTRAQ